MAYNELTLDSKMLKQYADCVEWCPINKFQHFFICTTYQLMEENVSLKKRVGSLNIFQVSDQGSLEEVVHLETFGILDVKWCPVATLEEEPLLAVADSEGRVLLYNFRRNVEGGKASLLLLDSLKCADIEETLCLSLDWSVAADKQCIAVSDSRGNISLVDVINNCMRLICRWKAHEHEAWVTIFDNQDRNVIYSGGDDSKFVMYDIRQESMVKRGGHDAGVTSLQCSKNENILASGSYDEVLRLWDKRNWKHSFDQINLGGGVWRIKWNRNSQCILAASMHAGFQLVNCSTSTTGSCMSSEYTYKNHDSLAYGCDWCHSSTIHQVIGIHRKVGDSLGLIATCSFYDARLNLWLLCLQNDI